MDLCVSLFRTENWRFRHKFMRIYRQKNNKTRTFEVGAAVRAQKTRPSDKTSVKI